MVATGCLADAPPTKLTAPIATTATTVATRFFKAAPPKLADWVGGEPTSGLAKRNTENSKNLDWYAIRTG
jgi:hypothetical protein